MNSFPSITFPIYLLVAYLITIHTIIRTEYYSNTTIYMYVYMCMHTRAGSDEVKVYISFKVLSTFSLTCQLVLRSRREQAFLISCLLHRDR